MISQKIAAGKKKQSNGTAIDEDDDMPALQTFAPSSGRSSNGLGPSSGNKPESCDSKETKPSTSAMKSSEKREEGRSGKERRHGDKSERRRRKGAKFEGEVRVSHLVKQRKYKQPTSAEGGENGGEEEGQKSNNSGMHYTI